MNYAVSYTFEKDSSGNYLMQQDYDKLQVYTRHGETENRMDAANAAQSINPVEKMLGHLLEAKVTAVVSPKGEVKEVRGYKELGDKILEGFAPGDVQGKAQAQSQWDKMIGQGLIKKNLDQFFTMFPDSTVRVGDKWKLQSDHSGEFNVQATTFYKLKAINDDIALIESEGEVTTEGGPASAGPQAAAHLNGRLQGEYSMDTKTGMLISCTIITKLEGAIQAMGWEIPVVIENKVKLKGKQVK